MEKRRTSWPWETRVKLVASYEELRRQNKDYSARQFSLYTEVPYSTFCRWLARWRRQGRLAHLDAPSRPRRCPNALSGRGVTLIRRAHQELGLRPLSKEKVRVSLCLKGLFGGLIWCLSAVSSAPYQVALSFYPPSAVLRQPVGRAGVAGLPLVAPAPCPP